MLMVNVHNLTVFDTIILFCAYLLMLCVYISGIRNHILNYKEHTMDIKTQNYELVDCLKRFLELNVSFGVLVIITVIGFILIDMPFVLKVVTIVSSLMSLFYAKVKEDDMIRDLRNRV